MNIGRIFNSGQEGGAFWCSSKRQKLAAIALCAMCVVLASYTQSIAQQPSQDSPGVSRRDLTSELALKVMAPFTIATVGDIIAPLPRGTLSEPECQNLITVIRGADVGFGNMESSLVDMAHFAGPIMGTLAPKEVGADIKAMGITMMNHANNHAFDGTEAGMFSTDDILDSLGIVHAGTGKDLDEARAAHFLGTPKGRVGLVGMVSIDTDLGNSPGSTYVYMSATYRSGNLGGRPGVSPVRLTTYHVVTPKQLQSLRDLRAAIVPGRANEGGGGFGVFASPEQTKSLSTATDRLRFFDSYFKAGATPGSVSYEVNSDDERDILRNIRNGKLYGDFLVATIHAHQGIQNIGGIPTVSDWLVDFAHKSIDTGADIFVVHGPHELGGVEIYNGKPIFYGLSAFVFQDDIQISHSDKATLTPPAEDPIGLTQGGGGGNQNPLAAAGMLATSHYENGHLVDVHLYPVDVGIKRRPMSLMGLPMTPSPEIAQRILEEMQTLSKPFNTKIEIEGGVGVIHVQAAKTSTK